MHYSLTDYILDIAQNSLEAGSSQVAVRIDEDDARLSVVVGDNGRGMSPDQLRKARDPFWSDGTKHRRKVGLGIPFLEQAVKQTGGTFDIVSVPGKGTEVSFSFPRDNVDTPPVGDVAALIVQMMAFDGGYELTVERRKRAGTRSGAYHVARSELADALGDIRNAESLVLAQRYVQSQEDSLLES